jgi:hypothetical protein
MKIMMVPADTQVSLFIHFIKDDSLVQSAQLSRFEGGSLAAALISFLHFVYPGDPIAVGHTRYLQIRTTVYADVYVLIKDLREVQALMSEHIADAQLADTLLNRVPTPVRTILQQFAALTSRNAGGAPASFRDLCDAVPDFLGHTAAAGQVPGQGGSFLAMHDGDAPKTEQMVEQDQLFAMSGRAFPCVVCELKGKGEHWHSMLACHNASCTICKADHPWFDCPKYQARRAEMGLPPRQQHQAQHQQHQHQGGGRHQGRGGRGGRGNRNQENA